jgi:hypothetical protein
MPAMYVMQDPMTVAAKPMVSSLDARDAASGDDYAISNDDCRKDEAHEWDVVSSLHRRASAHIRLSAPTRVHVVVRPMSGTPT